MIPDNNADIPLDKEEYRKILEFGIERLSEELSRVRQASSKEHMETVKRYILATLANIDNATGRWNTVR